jgi:imidazolonepropionase-like amidohydrolase
MATTISRRSVLAGTAAGVVGAAAGLTRSQVAGAAPDTGSTGITAIRGVTVIDAAAGTRREQNVLVRGNRILAAGDMHSVPVPHGAKVVDGRGKFLIPGLADMHTHAAQVDPTDPELYVVNGVTTTRQMGGDETVRSWRKEIEAGRRLGPQWLIASAILDGAPSLWEGVPLDYIAVADPAAGRAAVREQAAAGADFIKTYTRLSRESFLAIADEARKVGIPFLGHVPDFVEVTEASDAGMRSIEHLFEFWYDTSRDEGKLRREIAQIDIAGGDYNGWFTEMHPLEYAAAHSYERDKAARVFERLARNGTHVTPTLTVHWTCDTPQDVPHDDPRLVKYASRNLFDYWEWATTQFYNPAARSPQEVAQRRELFARRLRLAAELARAGVPIMTGTDLGTSYLLPGFSLHDELRFLVQAGLTPAQVLRAATLEPARSIGRRDQGTIERGNVADMVLLDANPLHDITNTTGINSVFLRGRLIDPAARQQMLAEIEEVAQTAPPPPEGVPAAAACPCHGVAHAAA